MLRVPLQRVRSGRLIAIHSVLCSLPSTNRPGASGSSDPDGVALSNKWDLNADGAYDISSGPTVTISWNDVVALDVGIDGPGTYPIAIEVSDGSKSAVATTALTVVHATPTLAIDWAGGTYDGNGFAASGSVIGFDGASFAGNLNYKSASATTTIAIAYEVNALTDLSKVMQSGRATPDQTAIAGCQRQQHVNFGNRRIGHPLAAAERRRNSNRGRARECGQMQSR